MARSLNIPSALIGYLLPRGALVALLLASACQIDDSFEGQEMVLDIHSDLALDQLVFYEGAWCSGCMTPLTPRMIAMGVVNPMGTVYAGTGRVVALGHDTQDYRYERAEPFGFSGLSKLLVLGYRREAGQMVLVSAATGDVTFPASQRFHTSMKLTDALVPGIEVWGAKRCAAVSGALFVDRWDIDCDGFPRDTDCNEGIYCNPADTSPAARAACQATTCEPCIGEINGACSLGTQAVCHDGATRTYTCEASASCGAPTCLPAAACQLGCAATSNTSDPLACVLNKWAMSTGAPDATNCRIPAMAYSNTNVACSNGSVVEVALPYTSCANPVLLAGGDLSGENWTLTITPSCLLHLEMNGPYAFDRRDLLVTFQTNTSTSTVRLALQAQAGTCGTIGSCDPVPTTALCSL